MTTEGSHGTHDGTEITWVRDVVQRYQQRGLCLRTSARQQVVGMRVLVRRDLQRKALM